MSLLPDCCSCCNLHSHSLYPACCRTENSKGLLLSHAFVLLFCMRWLVRMLVMLMRCDVDERCCRDCCSLLSCCLLLLLVTMSVFVVLGIGIMSGCGSCCIRGGCTVGLAGRLMSLNLSVFGFISWNVTVLVIVLS